MTRQQKVFQVIKIWCSGDSSVGKILLTSQAVLNKTHTTTNNSRGM